MRLCVCLCVRVVQGLEVPKRVFPCATPAEVRATLPKDQDVLAFQCRNPIHRYVCLLCLVCVCVCVCACVSVCVASLDTCLLLVPASACVRIRCILCMRVLWVQGRNVCLFVCLLMQRTQACAAVYG